MDIKRKGQSLKLVFFEYLLSVGLGLVLAAVVAMLSFNFIIESKLIIPSNYTEKLILENKSKIAEVDKFDESLIPNEATYLFISIDGKPIKSNMNANQQIKSIRFHNREEISTLASSYIEIKRVDGYVIINYSVQPHYSNAWMEKYLPSVNILFVSILILFCFISGLIITLMWARRLTKQLAPMMKASENIAKQDLDFEIGSSSIKEFNEVLNGLDDMKSALSESLRNGWIQEENRKSQISALTHDLKTPISIVQGNAELLKETELSEEQKEYVDYILKNTNRILDYAKALMVMNKTDHLNDVKLEEVNVSIVSDRILELAKEITSVSDLSLVENIDVDNRNILADLNLLERAVQNIICNAVEYAPSNSELKLQLKTKEYSLEIKVIDHGPGFSKSDLIHGVDQFYRGDKSRHSASNYGLGLYSTNQIIIRHNGSLLLENRTDTNGAVVIINLPIVDS